MDQHTKELIDKLVILEKGYMNEDAAYTKDRKSTRLNSSH